MAPFVFPEVNKDNPLTIPFCSLFKEEGFDKDSMVQCTNKDLALFCPLCEREKVVATRRLVWKVYKDNMVFEAKRDWFVLIDGFRTGINDKGKEKDAIFGSWRETTQQEGSRWRYTCSKTTLSYASLVKLQFQSLTIVSKWTWYLASINAGNSTFNVINLHGFRLPLRRHQVHVFSFSLSKTWVSAYISEAQGLADICYFHTKRHS